jgi:heme-degrading monooxygenase HmoA
MYATVRTYAGNRDLADTLAARADEVQQVIRGIDGFRAYYLLKTADGTTTISVFEDASGAEESNRAAAAWLAENLPELEIAPPQVTAGEAVLDF